MEQQTPKPETTPSRTTHRIGNVMLSTLVFYLVVSLFGAKGIYNWTTKLPVSEATKTLRQIAKKHWKRTSVWGLEEPAFTLETLAARAQDAHPLLYPRKLAEIEERKRRKKLKANEKPKYVKELLEPDEVPENAPGPKVLVLGDSIMMTVGPVIKKDIATQLAGAAVVKAKLATGLARPDVFNWVQEVRRMTARHHYNYAVLMLGTNDSQDFVENGEILTYGTSGWVKAYTRRLDDLMAAACEAADKAFWVGLPPMRSEAFNRKAVRINSWAKKTAEKHECMTFVPSDKIIGDRKGRYATYVKVADKMEKVRMVDGIHVTTRGGSILSSSLLDMMVSAKASTLAH
jgi:hypothetical protein